MKKERNCYANKNSYGEIISYRFYYSGKDPITEQPKQYTKTWKVPKGLSHKEIELQKKKAEIEFINEASKKSLGLYKPECNKTFEQFAEEWKERILKKNEDSYNYYERAKYALSIINPHLGRFMLNRISAEMVQNFMDYLCDRTYTKEIVTVKKSIYDLIDMQGLNKTQLAKDCGVERHTLELASKVGSRISMITAKIISKHFKVPLAKYFNVEKEEVKYAKASNDGIRRVLVAILGEAKRKQLVEHNYASRDYITPITGTTKEKEIFEEDEARRFVQTLIKEPYLKKRTALAVLMFLGLRRAEVLGLCWSDIDFENKTLSVKRNRIYTRTFGIKTKKTKTITSERTIKMPDLLVDMLKEYKVWYDNEKIYLEKFWGNNDSLFLRDNGKPMNPSCLDYWARRFNFEHGFNHIPPHAIRHTCITMQINAGIPLKVVSARAGHANEKITLGIYTHALRSQDDKAAEIYNNYLLA